MDQMPPPKAVAAATSHDRLIHFLDALIRDARLKAVYDANVAMRMDKTTRDESWVPDMIMTA
jgi:hypothetical protein